MALSVFVTGGTGFIGGHLLVQLAERGYRVKALKRERASTAFFHNLLKFYNKHELAEKVEWIDGDLNDSFALPTFLEGCDAVIHSAGKVSFSQKDWDDLLSVNKHGTANMVNASLEAGVKKFFLFSSVAALDMSLGIKGKKTDWKHFRKTQPYGYSKYLGELEAFRGQEEGLDICILRPAVVLGPSDRSNALNRFISKVRRGISYYPTGKTGYINVVDLCSRTIDLLENGHPEHTILCQGNMRFQETLKLFCEAGNYKAPSKKLSGLSLLALKTFIGFSETFGGKPKISSSGLAALCNEGGYDNSFMNAKNVETSTFIAPAIQEAVSFYKFQKELI